MLSCLFCFFFVYSLCFFVSVSLVSLLSFVLCLVCLFSLCVCVSILLLLLSFYIFTVCLGFCFVFLFLLFIFLLFSGHRESHSVACGLLAPQWDSYFCTSVVGALSPGCCTARESGVHRLLIHMCYPGSVYFNTKPSLHPTAYRLQCL